MRNKVIIFISLFVFVIAILVYQRLQSMQAATQSTTADKKSQQAKAVPVKVADITQGNISLRRSFTGTLKAHDEFVISPKIEGRIIRLEVDLADSVSKDMVVAYLDDAEYRQAVAQAKADVAVAQANLAEAKSLLVIAERELKRIDKLSQSGFNSVAEHDVAIANQLAKQAHLEVSKALLSRAQAQLEVANVKLTYTQVKASWQNGNEQQRIVAQTLVNEGETVSANTPLMRIVEFNPIKAVFFVSEKDFALLKTQQAVELSTDAFANEVFEGHISRIAPTFNEDSRQASVEVTIANPDLRLKPGMYIRANIVLKRVENTTIIPQIALTNRQGENGVFLVSADNKSVSWQTVNLGIRDQDQIQLIDSVLKGQVVTLGQQLLKDGSAILLEPSDQLEASGQ